MRLRALALALPLALVPVSTTGCRPAESSQSAVSREGAVAFASALAALEVLDELHLQRMRAIAAPTPEQVAWETAHHERLEHLRAALAIVREWLVRESTEGDGREAFRDAAELLTLVVAEMRSHGLAVPPSVDAGLAAASYFL
jgi:hypothetical protein